MNKLSLLLYLVLTANIVSAQINNLELLEKQQKYPEEALINEFVFKTIQIDLLEGKLKVYVENEEQDFILDDKASRFSKSSVTHSDLMKLDDIEAYALNFNGKKYQASKVLNYDLKDDIDGTYFHDDQKITSFNYDGLQKGSRRYIKYRLDLVEAAMLPSFFFYDYSPIELSVFRVLVHPDVNIGYKLINCDTIALEYSTTVQKNKYVLHEWRLKDSPSLEAESNAPNFRYYVPHIQIFIESYTKGNELIPYIDGVKGLHEYYNGFLSKINLEEDAALKEMVDSLLVGKNTELEKVKTIYQWVQNNIKYIAFEDGYGGFIPRQAKDIYQKRYGDCKDMSSILHEMMRCAGIASYWTWIGSRSIPYKYSELATTAVDNHMINTYYADGEFYFLDGTSSQTPFGMPSSFIQGKEALIHISTDSFAIRVVPTIPSEKNLVKDSLFIELEDDVLIGSARSSYSGYQRDRIVNYLYDYTADKRKAQIASYHELGSNKFNLVDFKEYNLLNKDTNYLVDYNFSLPDYALSLDDEIYINLHFQKLFANAKLKKNRKLPYEINFKSSYEIVNLFQIPEGYELKYLPENVSFENELFSFDFKFKIKEGKIILHKKLNLDFLILQPENFEEYNRFINELSKAYNEVLVLKKTTNE